ncbi:MAG: DUF2807 domain-containing protein [Chloroflexota bacterium]|nr:DUF2807 domain-containing protein [Chloroflexota bacterium]
MGMHHPGVSAERLPATITRRDAVRRVAAGGIAGSSAFALQQRSAGARGSQVPAAMETAARRAISAINQALASGDVSLLDGSFAPGYVNHTPHRSLATGRLVSPDLAGLKTSLTELRGAVPDAVIIVEDVVASGDMASVRVRFHGTLDPAVLDISAGSSQRVDVGGVAFGRIADGLVVESWDYDDAAELIGAIPVTVPEESVTEPGRGEVREVRDFEAVSLHGVGTLVIEQGDTEALTIEAEPHVLERIETRVDNGTLTIRPDQSFETSEPIRYNLSVKQLNRIEVAGAGQVDAERLTADELRIEVSDSGAVGIGGMTVTSLDVGASGSAVVELVGTAERQTVSVRDAGDYEAASLASRVASVTVEGASQATVRVSERLEAQVSGAGSIAYIGDPEVSQQVSDAGSLTKVE